MPIGLDFGRNVGKRLKLLHDIHDWVPDHDKGIGHHESASDASFLERYLCGKADLHIHGWVHSGIGLNGKAENFCALYQCAGRNVLAEVGNGTAHTDVRARQDDLGDVDVSMLVDARQLMQDPERIEGVLVPSVVGLRVLDDCFRSWPDAPGLVGPSLAIRLRVGENGELSPSTGSVLGFLSHQEPYKAIQSRAKVVDAISDDKAPPRRHWLDMLGNNHILSSLFIELDGESARVFVAKPLGFSIEPLQVILRPV